MEFLSLEDRNYYLDRRVTARRAEVPDGPYHWEVCDLCDGRGTVINPSIDANGLTGEDFAEDPDFATDYFNGTYDVQCPRCAGRTTVPVAGAARTR